MLKISKESKKEPEEVLKRAVAFFGPGGYGLAVKDKTICCAVFEGGGGNVYVTVGPGKKGSTVDIESVEWDYQAKEFLGKI